MKRLRGWPGILLLGWLWLLSQTLPIQHYWFEVDSVFVLGAPIGSQPVLIVDRTVHRPFEATWTAEVQRYTADGWETVPFAYNSATNLYSPGEALPKGDRLNLAWWINKPVFLPAGIYRIETRWTLNLGFFGSRVVSNMSNAFRVYVR
ncbi:MAG: hypothetical protein AAF468_19875 [Pseudomonadota bacterium]